MVSLWQIHNRKSDISSKDHWNNLSLEELKHLLFLSFFIYTMDFKCCSMPSPKGRSCMTTTEVPHFQKPAMNHHWKRKGTILNQMTDELRTNTFKIKILLRRFLIFPNNQDKLFQYDFTKYHSLDLYNVIFKYHLFFCSWSHLIACWGYL